MQMISFALAVYRSSPYVVSRGAERVSVICRKISIPSNWAARPLQSAKHSQYLWTRSGACSWAGLSNTSSKLHGNFLGASTTVQILPITTHNLLNRPAHSTRPPTMKTVVSPEWVNDNRTGLIALDASWYMPNATDKKSEAELKALHILPHTRRFDVDEVADKTQVSSSKDPKYTPKDAKPLPHMLPSREEFIKHAKKLRIKPSDKIVVYSANGFLASARAWWMLKLFGFDQVYVLDGGLASWTSAGIPFAKDTTEDSDYGIQSLKESDYDGNDIKFRSELLVTLDDILDLVETLNSSKSSSASIPPAFILDARSKGRFDATQPEPRAGIRRGHIPGSLNAPFQDFLDPKTGTILPVPALKEAFLAVHPQLDKSVLSKVVYSCGTGVTAAITALAAHEAGFPDPIVYDGSWTEYGGLPNVPIEP